MKKRYSEEFYSELDALIRLQHDVSKKRYESIQISVAQGDLEGKELKNDRTAEVDKSMFEAPPTFWQIASKNTLFRMMAAIAAVFVIAMTAAFVINTRQANMKAAENDILVPDRPIKASPAVSPIDIRKDRDKIHLPESHPAMKWPEPQSKAAVNTVPRPKSELEKYREITRQAEKDAYEENDREAPYEIGKPVNTSEGKIITY